jgi:hypothetical protein
LAGVLWAFKEYKSDNWRLDSLKILSKHEEGDDAAYLEGYLAYIIDSFDGGASLPS